MDLCPEIQENIRTTFLGLQDDPTAAKLLANLKTDRFVTMSDKDYDVVREAEAATMAAK